VSEPTPSTGALWAGRFDAGMSEALRAISFSLSFDKALLPYDIRGSQAHARSLGRLGVLSDGEVESIVSGLDGILRDARAGQDLFLPSDEDVHMAVERVLTERIGDPGRKLHTGRSRNDQVATAFRLYVRDQARSAHRGIVALQETVLGVAREHAGTVMAGYTHM